MSDQKPSERAVEIVKRTMKTICGNAFVIDRIDAENVVSALIRAGWPELAEERDGR